MSKKEVGTFGKDWVLLITIIAAFFASLLFLKNTSPTGYAVLSPPTSQSSLCGWIPGIIYVLMFVLVVVLLVYILRRHFIGHVLHTVWVIVLYELLVLSALLVGIEYIVCGDLIELAVFAIAAIIVVFIFDILLSLLARHGKGRKKKPVFEGGIKPKQKEPVKESVFDRLRRHMKQSDKPGVQELTELKQIIKELKEFKKK